MADAAAPLCENDQRVIDAMMSRADGDHSPLSPSGASWSALTERAREIGLTRQVIQQLHLAGTRPTVRLCLGCEGRFLSKGPHNRMCRRCRSL